MSKKEPNYFAEESENDKNEVYNNDANIDDDICVWVPARILVLKLLNQHNLKYCNNNTNPFIKKLKF